MINPTDHADAILAWMESEIGTVSRDELRARIEQEVRDVARRAYEDAAQVAMIGKLVNMPIEYGNGWFDGIEEYTCAIRALKAGL